MATVFNTLIKPNGQPLRNVDVSVSLSWDTDGAVFVKNENNDTVIDNTAKTRTDVDGYWEMTLTPNSSLTPASVYKVIETVDSVNINTYFIEIPVAATPTFWVGDIIVSQPAWES